MAEFIQNLDPSKLVVVETVLTFISSVASPPYNFPLFLFGVYAQENADASQSLRLFTAMLGGSVILDIVWLSSHDQNWFFRLVSVLVLLLKAPTFFAFAMRQRGDQFSGLGSLGIRGGDLNGPTVWAMPGGFSSSRDGYTEVGEENAAAPRPPPPPVSQSSQAPQPAVQPSTTGTAGGYQTV